MNSEKNTGIRNMTGLEALKRIRQETCSATYMQDFDKEKCCDVIEKELKAFKKLKQHIEEEYKGLINAMQRNLDFSDEEDVRHYEKLRAQAYILNKFLKEVLK